MSAAEASAQPGAGFAAAPASSRRSALYIDMAYTVEMVRHRGHLSFFESRHSGGYFERVWGLHPLADRVSPHMPRSIQSTEFTPRQTIIEGRAELLRLPKWLLPVNFLVSQLRLLQHVVALVKREKVTWIVATDPLYSGLFAWALSRLCNVPYAIWVVANYDDLYAATGTLAMPKLIPSRSLEKKLIAFTLARADLVAPATATLRSYCLRNGGREAVTELLPVARNLSPVHMVPPEQRGSPAEVLKRYKIPSARRYLLTISRLEPVKHVDHAVLALRRIVDEFPDALCIFAGDGSLRERLLAQAQAAGLGDHVAFPGVIDQESLSVIIPHCVTLSPLTGMALNECALGGSPVVAYDRDSQIGLLVRSGETGFLVPFLDHAAMAEGAIRILRDDATRARMARNIRALALEHSDLGKLFAHEGATFEKMAARSAR